MKIKSYFKIPLTKEKGVPSITEIKYTGEDGAEYTGLQFEGYASTKDLDRGGDIVLPEAFLKKLPTYMANSILLFRHDHEKEIGSIIEARVDDQGLYVKGIVKVDEDNVFKKLRTGVIKTMSIGYTIDNFEETIVETEGQKQYVYVLKDIELYEISLVGVPMNANAKLKGKSINELSKDEVLETSDEDYKKCFKVSKNEKFTLSESIKIALQGVKTVKNEVKELKEDVEIEVLEGEDDVIDEEIEEITEEIPTETVEKTDEVVENTPETTEKIDVEVVKSLETKENEDKTEEILEVLQEEIKEEIKEEVVEAKEEEKTITNEIIEVKNDEEVKNDIEPIKEVETIVNEDIKVEDDKQEEFKEEKAFIKPECKYSKLITTKSADFIEARVELKSKLKEKALGIKDIAKGDTVYFRFKHVYKDLDGNLITEYYPSKTEEPEIGKILDIYTKDVLMYGDIEKGDAENPFLVIQLYELVSKTLLATGNIGVFKTSEVEIELLFGEGEPVVENTNENENVGNLDLGIVKEVIGEHTKGILDNQNAQVNKLQEAEKSIENIDIATKKQAEGLQTLEKSLSELQLKYASDISSMNECLKGVIELFTEQASKYATVNEQLSKLSQKKGYFYESVPAIKDEKQGDQLSKLLKKAKQFY